MLKHQPSFFLDPDGRTWHPPCYDGGWHDNDRKNIPLHIARRWLGRILALYWVLSLTSVNAATYYIDFQNGNDMNDGLTRNTAWKTLPGTRNAADTADQATSWGPGPTFNTSLRVPGGTVFKLKSGSVLNYTNGGRIYLSRDTLSGPPYLGTGYYGYDITTNNPVFFQRDTNWGSGSVVFDGSGITYADTGSSGFFYTRNVGGFIFDGVQGVTSSYDGIVVQNTFDRAFFYWLASADRGGSDTGMGGITIQYFKFFNCGTQVSYLADAWESHYVITLTMDTSTAKTIDRVQINHVEINCNGLFTGGIRCGEQPGRIINGDFHDLLIYNSGTGDVSDVYKNARGITTKNSQVVISNAITHHLIKGQDHSCPLTDPGSPWLMWVVNVNPVSYSNELMGLGHNGPFGVSGSTIFTNVGNFYVINGLIYDNGGPGVKAYSGSYNLYIVNSTFAGNAPNVLASQSDWRDTNAVNVYCYDNLFYKPAEATAFGNASVAYWQATNTTIKWHSDYNSYVAAEPGNLSEPASVWSAYSGVPPNYPVAFYYGADGPGHSSGVWWNFYGWHNDAHSVGTGSAVSTSSPPFVDAAGRLFALTDQYPGANLSAMPWFRPEMGIDRAGIARSEWDMGAYEYTSTAGTSSGSAGSTSGGAITNVADGLSGWWKLDEGSGAVAQDSTMNAYNGTVTGPVWVSGETGGALGFYGTNWVNCGGYHLNGTGARSIAAWVRFTATDEMAVASRWQWGGRGVCDLCVSGGQAHFRVSADGANWSTADSLSTYNDGSWHHVVGIYEPSTALRVFVDGTVAGEAVGGVPGALFADDPCPFTIGVRACSMAPAAFVGAIDDVRWYDRALTPAEVSMLYGYTSAGDGSASSGDGSTSPGTGSTSPGAGSTSGGAITNVADGLSGWWKFDEGSGATAQDSTMNAYQGTVTGPVWVSGETGGALGFYGTNGVNCGGYHLNGTGARSIAAWVRFTATDEMAVASRWQWGGRGVCDFCVSGGKVHFRVSGDGLNWSAADSLSTYNDGSWHHVVGIYEPSTALRVFVDGTVAGETVGGVPGALFADDPCPFTIGVRACSMAPAAFVGAIDDVRWYDRALTPAEVNMLYGYTSQVAGSISPGSGSTSPGAGSTSGGAITNVADGLSGWWKFDEGSGATAQDSTMNAYQGTVTGPVWVSGETGGALGFYGTNGVNCGGYHLNGTGARSIAAWVRFTATDEMAVASRWQWGGRGVCDLCVSGGQVHFRVSADGLNWSAADSLSTYNDGSWHHVVGIYEPSTALRVFVDGTVAGDAVGGIPAALFADDPCPFTIGVRACSMAPAAFVGAIDDVRWYDRALMPDEVSILYQWRGP